MLKIKLSVPGFQDNLNISQFIGNDQNIGFGCQFYINDHTLEEADYWFVIDDLQQKEEHVSINRENVFFLSAEVAYEKGHYDYPHLQKFLDQFQTIFTCHDIFKNNTKFSLPFLGWMVNANHGPSIFAKHDRDINWFKKNHHIDKTKMLSVFCSAKQLSPDHKLRFKFVKALKEHFGDRLDWYGNGVKSLTEKWDGIAPYKYHIVLENQSRNNIITEKLYDSFLALAYPIYCGAQNVGDYFKSDSLTQIDMMDLNGAIEKIELLLKDDVWESKLPLLIESKMRVLSDYNVFNRIAEIAKTNEDLFPNRVKQPISLFASQKFKPYLSIKIVLHLTGRILRRISDKMISFSQ